ncbi:MAG: YbjN domain-containing protein [Leptolyngbyaceae cyanobacterium bins.59]|nr:YbjN domain-containing protein [Leptolyngbyaceae cyanobacterium bins.59]
MEFITPVQQACYERIKPWMEELFKDAILTFDEKEPLFIVNFGSASAFTEVVPWGEGESIIVTQACVVTDLEITPDLMYYLLRENDSLYFGRFSIDTQDDVIFEHSLVGSTCDKQELKTSVITVVKFADEYDDKIVARWGGHRALDRQLVPGSLSEDEAETE